MNSLNKIQINSTGLLDAFLDTGYTESPEWIRVITDNQDKVLGGIKSDGSIEWAIGVPTPVREYIDSNISEIINGNEGISIDGLNKIISFLEDFTTSDKLYSILSNKADASLLDNKVDKEEGKSLIPTQYIQETEHPEYLKVTTDVQGKILCGIKNDGTVYIPILDNPGIDSKLNDAIQEFNEKAQQIEDDIDAKLALYDEIISCFDLIEDPEGRSETTIDAEGRVLCYREKDGILVENVGIKTTDAYINSLSVGNINYSLLPKCTDKEYVYLERPKFGELLLYGNLPTDTSDARIPTTLDFVFKVNGETKLAAKCTLAIQGHGSAGYSKKGYTFEPLNSNSDALEIKFGNMIATDSFHLKAFATDQTHARDIGGYKVWERMIRALDYPYNKVNNIPFEFRTSYKKNLDALADAQYHPDGFPNVVYLNGEFLGLYTLRLKKSRQNYAMEKSVKSMIFLDATNYNVYDEQGHMILRCSNLSIPFDHRGWDLKNPKLKNYEEGGEIPDAGVLANIERLFNFTSDLNNQYQNYADFIILPHWLVYIITEELLFSEDSVYNNMNLLTWDATHWSILPYDLDLTYGLHAWDRTLYDVDKMNRTMLADIFPRFKQLFNTELRALYTKFRQEGIISVEALITIYRNQINSIPRDVYEDDFNKWGSIWDNGNTTIEHINRNVAARIEYLDSIWLNNN